MDYVVCHSFINLNIIMGMTDVVRKFSAIRKHLMEVMQPSEIIQMTLRIFNVFLLIFFIAHLSSSGFVWVATMMQNRDPDVRTWISANGLLDVQWLELYINGLYWAIISMSAVSQSFISPHPSVLTLIGSPSATVISHLSLLKRKPTRSSVKRDGIN